MKRAKMKPTKVWLHIDPDGNLQEVEISDTRPIAEWSYGVHGSCGYSRAYGRMVGTITLCEPRKPAKRSSK